MDDGGIDTPAGLHMRQCGPAPNLERRQRPVSKHCAGRAPQMTADKESPCGRFRRRTQVIFQPISGLRPDQSAVSVAIPHHGPGREICPRRLCLHSGVRGWTTPRQIGSDGAGPGRISGGTVLSMDRFKDPPFRPAHRTTKAAGGRE